MKLRLDFKLLILKYTSKCFFFFLTAEKNDYYERIQAENIIKLPYYKIVQDSAVKEIIKITNEFLFIMHRGISGTIFKLRRKSM